MPYAPILRVLATVKAEVTHGKNALGFCTEPEIYKVKVVGGFVHQETAAVALVAVPAPVVIRAVVGIQQPLKMHGKDLADGLLHHYFTDLGIVGRVPVVKGHREGAAGARR